MPTQYGKFHDFCRDSTLPVCNLFNESPVKGGLGYGGCELTGIHLSNGRLLRNLGVILLDGAAILTTLGLLWATQRRKAAVGRRHEQSMQPLPYISLANGQAREIQLFLVGYIILSICEIFTIGGIPLNSDTVIGFTGVHLGIITAVTWMLMINGAVGYQALDDGSFLSLALLFASTAALFIGTGYIALDTGYDWSGYWNNNTTQNAPNQEYSLYTLYLLAPLVFLFVYFWLAFFLVVRVLGERKPLVFLCGAVLLFAIGQIFTFLISTHICNGTSGAIDGSMFQTFFNLLAVVMVWVFWTSITEQDWPLMGDGEPVYQ